METFRTILKLLMAASAAAALVAQPASAETTLRLAHHHAVGGVVDKTAHKVAELVNAKTSGQLQIQVFPAAQLGQEYEAFDLLNQGVVDMTITGLALMDRYWAPARVISLPFVFRDWDHLERSFDGDFGMVLRDGIKANSDAEVLGMLALGFRDMLFRGDPVTLASDMQGLKMRSPEQRVWIRMFELLGARPTPVTWGEVYTAMQTGVADGMDSDPGLALDMKFNEVTKSIVQTGHMISGMGIAANKDRVAALPAAQQEALRSAGKEAAEWSNRTISRPRQDMAYEEMRSKGMQVVAAQDPSAWAAMVTPLWDEMAGEAPGLKELIDLLVKTP